MKTDKNHDGFCFAVSAVTSTYEYETSQLRSCRGKMSHSDSVSRSRLHVNLNLSPTSTQCLSFLSSVRGLFLHNLRPDTESPESS